jgi:UDPglucose 6-dehydrogenase
MKIAVIGAGYVGLTTGVGLAQLGHSVTCVDTIANRVETVSSGKVPFHEPDLPSMLAAVLASGRFRCTGNLRQAVSESEVTFITVGTPQSGHSVDLNYVSSAARQIGAVLASTSGYHVIAVKSTVPPGTTDTLVRHRLEEVSGKRCGQFGLCMNPEFLAEGSAVQDFMNPDRIIIGQWDEKSGRTLERVYERFDCPKIHTGLRNAEIVKYASNALLATLISFSNEIAGVCEATPDTNVNVVLESLCLDRRLSPIVEGQRINPGILSFLWAGCGYGGSCLPKDIDALRAYAREKGLAPRLLDAVVEINGVQPERLVHMAKHARSSLRDATVAVLGLAFKAGTDDLRQSTALKVIRLLLEHGAKVKAYDPIVKELPYDFDEVTLCASPEQVMSATDAALITTACPEFASWDWARLCCSMRHPVVIDGRNAYHRINWPDWVKYLPMGRGHDHPQPESVVSSGRVG